MKQYIMDEDMKIYRNVENLDVYIIGQIATNLKNLIYSDVILLKLCKNNIEKEIMDEMINSMVKIVSCNSSPPIVFINEFKKQCNLIKISYRDLFRCKNYLDETLDNICITKKISMNNIINDYIHEELINYIKNNDCLDKNILLSMVQLDEH
jgi:hypothetical protein